MGKMTNLILLVCAIHFAFFITGYTDLSLDSLTQLILHPESWTLSYFLGLIFSNIVVIGGFATLALAAFIFRTDTMMFAGMAGVLVGWLGEPLLKFFQALSDSSNPVIALLVCIPILILYIFTAVSWWRGRSD